MLIPFICLCVALLATVVLSYLCLRAYAEAEELRDECVEAQERVEAAVDRLAELNEGHKQQSLHTLAVLSVRLREMVDLDVNDSKERAEFKEWANAWLLSANEQVKTMALLTSGNDDGTLSN